MTRQSQLQFLYLRTISSVPSIQKVCIFRTDVQVGFNGINEKFDSSCNDNKQQMGI